MKHNFSDNTSETEAERLGRLYPIILCEHSSEYKALYKIERDFLLQVFDGCVLRVNHIGSTAVPDLIAKPTIDILLEIKEGADLSEITEKLQGIGFPKVYELLKSGGTLAMMIQKGDYKTPNEALFNDIQKVYSAYFHPENPYTCRLDYENVVNYGFTDFERREYPVRHEFTTEGFLSFISTHSDHIVLKDPERTLFFDGIRDAINAHGGRLVSNDTVALYLARKG